jgi:hypothetical protein
MKNEAVEQIGVELGEGDLDSVSGGTSVAGIAEAIVAAAREAAAAAARQASAPVLTPSNGPYFGASFDYEKQPFEQPH